MGGHHRAQGYSDTWLTPRWILDPLGHFDTDPACPSDMPWRTADKMLTIDDNGLMQPWEGRVWLNPPYGRDIGVWLDKMAGHGNGIALIFARTETDAFHRYVWEQARAVFFFRGRIDFLQPTGEKYIGLKGNGNAGAPSCLVAYTEHDALTIELAGFSGRLLRL